MNCFPHEDDGSRSSAQPMLDHERFPPRTSDFQNMGSNDDTEASVMDATMADVRAYIDKLHDSHRETLEEQSLAANDPPTKEQKRPSSTVTTRSDPPPETNPETRNLSPERNEVRAPRPVVLKPEPTFQDEKKEEGMEDIKEVLKWLFGVCATANDAQYDYLEEFLALVHFSAPLLMEEPSAWQVQQIQEKGRKLGLSSVAVDRFIEESLQQVEVKAGQRGLDAQESKPSVHLTLRFLRRFERRSIEHMTSLETASAGVEVKYDPNFKLDFGTEEEIEGVNSLVDNGTEASTTLGSETLGTTSQEVASKALYPVEGKPLDQEITQFWEDFKKASMNVIRNPLALPLSLNEDEESVFNGSFDGDSVPTYQSNSHIWLRRRSMAKWNLGAEWRRPQSFLQNKHETHVYVEEPEPIDATVCSRSLEQGFAIEAVAWNLPGTSQWKRKYASRTKKHRGYHGVNIFSLRESSATGGEAHELDNLPWERRDVPQRFLHEQSISYRRNWFGRVVPLPGNDHFKEPVCRPKSMEMPIKISEWTDEWYQKPWLVPIESALSGSSALNRYGEGDDLEVPECGTFKLVKQRIGEPISLVCPGHASFVRRSRWRKTYVQPLE